MHYNTGDRLKLTGISGNYSTVITDVPASSKAITFNFIACTHGYGNDYPIVQIGTQIWMAENLKTTRYNDETSIPNVTDPAEWLNLTAPGYCWYNNDAATYKITYGALYNWYAVNTGKLCPAGWHVPSEPEFYVLDDYLGSEGASGGKIKEAGTTHWYSPNTGATNETGWTGLPGGQRYDDFRVMGYYGFYWTTLDYSTTHAGVMILYYNVDYADGDWYKKQNGFSVRCLKNP
ncbi:MAG: fibrobacter succinogenes major paralogous domain-containing protein [Bacteroidales bacterium]|nr:fibrobacter succinogenes major paralogous domain-containing protein [Bacteroidales bacterium]